MVRLNLLRIQSRCRCGGRGFVMAVAIEVHMSHGGARKPFKRTVTLRLPCGCSRGDKWLREREV